MIEARINSRTLVWLQENFEKLENVIFGEVW